MSSLSRRSSAAALATGSGSGSPGAPRTPVGVGHRSSGSGSVSRKSSRGLMPRDAAGRKPSAARWRDKIWREPDTGEPHLLSNGDSSTSVSRTRSALRRYLEWNFRQRQQLRLEARAVLAIVLPPLNARAACLRTRLQCSDYRQGKDRDAGVGLPHDRKHPVFSLVRGHQSELLRIEKELK